VSKRLRGMCMDTQAVQRELNDAATQIVACMLSECGFGPDGFNGSWGSLVAGFPGFRTSPNFFSYLHELGVDLHCDWHHILCSWAETLERRDEPLPAFLRRYIIRTAKNGHRKERTNAARDLAIATAVEWVCATTRLKPSRNEASKGSANECGASLVSQALGGIGFGLDEKRIANIHAQVSAGHRRKPRSRKRPLTPGYDKSL
jgi:hypothetical protein